MADDVYQLELLGQSADEPVANVMHFSNDGTANGDPVDGANDCLNAFDTGALTEYLDCLPQDYKLLGSKAKRVNNSGGPTVVRPEAGSPGTINDDSNNSAIGPLITFPYLAALGWRVGKLFLPSISQISADGNIIDPALLGNLATFINKIFPLLGGSGNFSFVVWSRQLLIPYIPLNASVSLKLGVQRRRLLPVL